MDTILVCDASQEEFETLRELLKNVANCCNASSAAEAEGLLNTKKLQIAAVIVDIDATDGAVPLVTALDTNPVYAALPFLVSSARDEMECWAIAAGAQYFLHKPFHGGVLTAKLNAAVRRRKDRMLRKMAEERNGDAGREPFRLDRFYRIVDEAVERQSDSAFTVISFDINHFKLFNDFYGHETSNAILHVGNRILRSYAHCVDLARSEQSVGFCMCVSCSPQVFIQDYPELERQLQDAFGNIPLDITMGLCRLEAGHDTAEAAYEKAVFAHKDAAREENRRFCIYDASLREKRKRKQFILSSFNDGIRNHEFIPYIQPKYNLYTETFVGGEVLCRWKHDGQLISPGEFIPILEENGLIAKLDRYMLSETLKIIKGWINHEIMPLPLSVNLSRISFYQNNLTQDILAMIDEIGVPHSLIQIEITESAYVELEERVIAFVDAMLKNGIEVLMDDFGSGYSSLNMLRNINVSWLKVDYNFLGKARIPARREQMLESIVKLARTIRVPIVVEGVETEEDAILLKGMGVRYVQGFFYARPMPLDAFDALPKKGSPQKQSSRFATALLDTVSDIQSTARQLFDLSLSAMAVCEYTGDALYLVQSNPALQNFFFTDLNPLAHGRKNVLPYVAAQDRSHVETYIRDVCRQIAANDFVECDFVTSVGTTRLKLRFTLLAQRRDGFVLLMDSLRLYSSAGTKESSTLFEVLDRMDRGYYIMGQNHEILYLNDRAKQIVPNFAPGVKCTDYKRFDEDCTQCPLENYEMPMSYYSQALNAFVENYVSEIRLNGEKAKLVRIDLNTGKLLSTRDAVMRMNRAIVMENDVYTEVNLETLRYQQITFAKHKTFDIPTEGDYTVNYEDMAERQIDKATQADVQRYFSAEGMRRAYADGRRIRARFRFAGTEKWGECVGTFLSDGGTRYCCVYTRDITAEMQRDCDWLTGLLNVTAARKTVNDCLTENAARPAALLVLDFDNFKAVNDRFGHAFGDRVLTETARCLEEIGGENVLAARIGGDEFAVFVKDASDTDALCVLREKLCGGIAQISVALKIDALTSISTGLAGYPADAQTFTELSVAAERRMYRSKAHHGRKT